MKKNFSKIASVVLVVLIIASMMVPAMAKASDQLSSYCASVSGQGGGLVGVSLDVAGTGIMTTIGYSRVIIYEKQAGDWVPVKSFSSGMTNSNDYCYVGSVSYNGRSGYQYYAEVTCFATNAKGTDSRTFNTSITTA